MIEESFPRGGIAKPGSGSTAYRHKQEPDLFQIAQRQHDSSIKHKSKSKARKYDKRKSILAERTFESEGTSTFTTIEKLSVSFIVEDMLILGRVKEIREYNIIIALPNNITGQLAITDICHSYTEALRAIACEQGDEYNIPSLDELFIAGQLLRCRVKEILSKGEKRKDIHLSIEPKIVNRDVDVSKLTMDIALHGNVSSIEDHGYSIDLGISGYQIFLTNNDAEGFLAKSGKSKLRLCQFISCRVKEQSLAAIKSGDRRVLNVTLNSDLGKVPESCKGIAICNILPGTVVSGEVISTRDQGVIVKFMDTQCGFVHKNHLTANPTKYTKDQSLPLCILYNQPLSQMTALSALPFLVNPKSTRINHHKIFQIGDIVEGGHAIDVDHKAGVLLRLPNDVNGFLPKKLVSDKLKQSSLKNFVGAKDVRCRVVDFDLMNNVAIVATKQSIFDRCFLRFSDCQPGQIVECVVRGFHNGGISVLVSKHIRAFIPPIHNANIPLQHPEKKYKVDDAINCRVLKVDHTNRKMTLTAKQNLVNSQLPILCSMEQLNKDLVAEGVVVLVKNDGVVVAFYGDLKGFVHKSQAGVEEINVLDKVFYPGQVVKCRVLSWEDDTGRIRLSFRIDGRAPLGTGEIRQQAALDAAKLHRCIVSNVNLERHRLDVKVGLVSGIIPMMHLSDNVANCKHILMAYKTGSVIDEALLFTRSTTPVFSIKPSLLAAMRDDLIPECLTDLIPGSIVAGVVRNATTYGLFVNLSHSLHALAINSYITDRFTPEPFKLFEQGQSVQCFVRDVDRDAKRISVSLRVSDCYHGDTGPMTSQLACYLRERDAILRYYSVHGDSAMKMLTSLTVGAGVEVTVTALNEYGALGNLNGSQVKFICTIYHMMDVTVKVGDVRRAVVLHLDLDNKCVEISLTKKTLKQITRRVESRSNQIKVGTNIDAEVLLVKPQFVLVGLRGHAEFKLAYAPSRKSLNDVTGSSIFEPGFVDRVIIKSVSDHVICVWEAYEVTNERMESVRNKRVQSHQLDIGYVVKAVVRAILPFQLNVRIGSTPGRVFVSEIEPDECPPGHALTERFHVNEQISVVVIGFRDAKTLKTMESLSKKSTALPECSMLKSRMSGQADSNFRVGDEVPAFYRDCDEKLMWMRITPTLNGKVYILNASNDISVLQNPGDHFAQGGYHRATVIDIGSDHIELSLVGAVAVEPGLVVNGCVLAVKRASLLIRLHGNKKGVVTLTEMSDEYSDDMTSQFTVGQYVRCYVIAREGDRYALSLRPSRIVKLPLKPAAKDKVIESAADLIRQEIVRGFITMAAQNSVTVTLGRDVCGKADLKHLSDYHVNKVKAIFQKNKVVSVKVLEIGDVISVSLKETDTGMEEIVPLEARQSKLLHQRKRRLSDRRLSESLSEEFPEVPMKRVKITDLIDDLRNHEKKLVNNDKMDASTGDLTVKPIKGDRKRQNSDCKLSKNEHQPQLKRARNSSEQECGAGSSLEEVDLAEKINAAEDDKPRLCVSQGFSWSNEFTLPVVANSESSDEEDEKDVKEVTKEDKRLEEKRLYELENRFLDKNRTPETEDEFDRLVVQSPDSSIIWLQYMAHHLKMAEVDKARKIAERALKTISFREEQEKMNVYVALMNLENTYGSAEQLREVFDRAVQVNDSLKVHQQLLKIYESSGKTDQAEHLHSTMGRQFARHKDVWTNFGAFYFAQSCFESARKVLERSLKCLDKRDHMEVVTKFARMEFEYGQTERGGAIFDSVLAECPKRIDVWFVYIDLMVKFSTLDKVRKIFNRVVAIKIPVKKMKSVFKKWIEFEKKHGDDKTLDEVKERARKFVASAPSGE